MSWPAGTRTPKGGLLARRRTHTAGQKRAPPSGRYAADLALFEPMPNMVLCQAASLNSPTAPPGGHLRHSRSLSVSSGHPFGLAGHKAHFMGGKVLANEAADHLGRGDVLRRAQGFEGLLL